jgi:hypothetical protein
LAELETQVELAVRLKYINAETAAALESAISRTGQLLHGLHRSARRSVALTALGWLFIVTGTSTLLLFVS